MVRRAESIGPHTARLFERILAAKPHPEMGYRGCLGIIRLAGRYSPIRIGSRRRAGATHRCLSLSEREVDSQERARSATGPDADIAGLPAADSIRKHCG